MKKTLRNIRRITSLLLVIILCAGFVNTDAATVRIKVAGAYKNYTGKTYKVYINGTKVNNALRPGIMYNDNIMIPYKTTLINSKKIKMTSSYSSASRALTLKYADDTVTFYVNRKYMLVNGSRVSINTAPIYSKMYGSTVILVPAKALALHAFYWDYYYDRSNKAVYITTGAEPENVNISTGTKLKAAQFKGMSTAQFVAALGPVARANYKETGILASVTLAQAILESGWGKSGLAQKSNNLFGMKTSLSGNTWKGSVWDGKSYVAVRTREEYGGRKVTITAKFRKYQSVAHSIADHSAYLLNAKNGSSRRYAGLAAATTYSKQIDIIRRGGYCTWSSYKSELIRLIKTYKLARYDKK